MLGEEHSLSQDFPSLSAQLARLLKSDAAFAKDNEDYNRLDSAIRQLELDGAPVSDAQMNQKKRQRAMLKDSLYQRLLAASP